MKEIMNYELLVIPLHGKTKYSYKGLQCLVKYSQAHRAKLKYQKFAAKFTARRIM